MSKPTGKLLFAYNTITALNERIAELEKENAILKNRIYQHNCMAIGTPILSQIADSQPE